MGKLTDEEFLAENAHVPTIQVRKDIEDTEAELVELRQQRRRLGGPQGIDRMADMKLRATSDKIDKRVAFIKDLRRLLQLRGEG